MIGALAERLRPRVTAADLVERTDHTLSVIVDHAGDATLVEDRSERVHIRVAHLGRVGWSAGPADRAADIVETAITTARSGPELELLLPAPAPLAAVVTSDATARVGPSDLVSRARALRDRLVGRDRRVEVWAECSVGEVRIANTRGVAAAYPKSLMGLGARLRTVDQARSDALHVDLVSTGAPAQQAIEALADEVDHYLHRPVLDAWEAGPVRAWLAPAAVRTLLGPVLASRTGERWLTERDAPGPALDHRLTLIDDPHAAGRPGSRPICDDGVPTFSTVLVDRGRLRGGIADLATACRHGVPSTGHGTRRPEGAPRAAFSNLRLLPNLVEPTPAGGPRESATSPNPMPPEQALGDGVLVLELGWGPAPSRATGIFRSRAPWTLLVRDGVIVGRLDGAVLAGDVFELLREVVGVGAVAEWRGAWELPPLIVDGVMLGR